MLVVLGTLMVILMLMLIAMAMQMPKVNSTGNGHSPLPCKLSATTVTRSRPQRLNAFNMQSAKTRGFKNTAKRTRITSFSGKERAPAETRHRR